MVARKKNLILNLVLVMIMISACAPSTGSSQAGDNQGDDMDRQVATSAADSGSANLSYTYIVEQKPIFKISVQLNIPLVIEPGENPGSYNVHGFGQTNATLEMMGVGGPTGSCLLVCDVPALYFADGTLELDDVNSDCMIPIKITRRFEHEETVVTGDCPSLVMENFDCATLYETLIDPHTYTFTKEFRELDMPVAAGVTLRGKIKDVVMPPGVGGICNW